MNLEALAGKGLTLKLESIKEKLLLTYISELKPAKKITIAIEPRLYKENPSLLLFIDEMELGLFQREEGFYLITQDTEVVEKYSRLIRKD